MQKKLKIGLNPKIIFHWILIITIISLFSLVIMENPPVIISIIGLLFLSLFFNRTNYLTIDSKNIVIKDNFFIFINRKVEVFNFKGLERIIIKDNGANITLSDMILYEYIFAIFSFLSGGFFYDKRFELRLIQKSGEEIMTKVNIQRVDIKRLIRTLTKETKMKVEYIENKN